MSEDTTRRRFLTAAGSGVAAALAGCSGNQPNQESTAADTETATEVDTATATPEPEKSYTGGTLQMASEGPIQTLDPVNAKGSGAGYNQYQQSLMAFPDGDLPPVGELATDYEVSDDGITYTFTLREDVTFHDGQELTAEDFVYSWERLAGAEETRNADDIVGSTFTLAHEGNTGESVTNYVPGSLAVRAVDDYTFEFDMETPFHAVISQIAGGAFGVIPAGSVDYPKDYESHGLDGLLYEGEYSYNEYFSTSGDGPFFAGTGPFEVDAWSKGDQLELAAYDDYWGEGPYIDGIVYTVIGNASTRFQRFRNGNLDILGEFPTAQFNPQNRSIDRNRGSYRTGTYTLDNGTEVNYGEATALDTDYIVFNCTRTEKAPRQAIAYLLNQDQIAQQVYKGLPDPAYHLTPPPVFMARDGEEPSENYQKHVEDGFRNELDSASDGYPYGVGETKLQEAKAVMEEAGYGEDNRYSMEFTVFSGNSAWDSIAGRLRDKAASAYIDLDITKADFGTIISNAINGSMDMFALGDGMEWPESDNFLRFIPPYDSPGNMFTRWTTRTEAPGLDFNGNDPETIKQDLLEALPDEVEEQHVTVTPASDTDGQGTAAVFIEPVTADDLANAIDEAGYSSSTPSQYGEFDPMMKVSEDGWEDNYVPNRGPGEEEQRARNVAYYIQEEINWEFVQELPTTHTVYQRVWSQDVDVRMHGTMENQTFNTVTIDRE
ncbi:ABC transporter substrate-binding protein [Halobaculum litoreum]|uniref:ABC transporter substrate-binding protein n=1 Tax=Halobaculum litoreum TaxID=3031998 RepID=UPI0024C35D00|nr:ABC transporter substrate-binding protein [Halobaculum sp. DT92]